MREQDIIFAPEDMEKLTMCETELKRILQNSYKRNTTIKEDNAVREVLAKYGINKYKCGHCPQVIFEMYRCAAKIYFRSIEVLKEESITAELTTPINIVKPTKKRGRPKKENNEVKEK